MFFQSRPQYFRPLILTFLLAGAIGAQISPSAYRVLGQSDLQQNGLNRVQGLEMYNPFGVAMDFRNGAVHLYVSDTRNNRVMGWTDARSYQIGDPASVVLGQPNAQRTNPLGIGAKGFNAPLGLTVDPNTGNLYVADFGNNRVLRFPNPFSNPSRIEPDAVYGQADFNGRSANPFGVVSNSLNGPRAVAFDSTGNLWVADAGNHRVLRFNAAVLNAINPSADIVLGQKDFLGGSGNRGSNSISASGFDTPAGLAFDRQDNLYVSDFRNTRVLKFIAPISLDEAATTVFGEANFVTRGVPVQASASTLAGPQGLCVDSAGNLYVAVANDNRILMFAAGAPSGAAAINLWGQVSYTATSANASAFPYASASTLSGVSDVKMDPDGNLLVADTGNNRVVSFARNSKSASQLWGQLDFSSNGINQIKPGSINAPFKIAIDYSQSPFALYASDVNNHRILIWKDATAFRSGDPADLVIGQPNLGTAIANVDTRGAQNPSSTSLSSPRGIVLDAGGNLWVADSGNNRVLRYPRPVDQPGRITPDTVLGQADFTSNVSAAVTASSLNTPAGVAVGPNGDIFVSDSGNNRVLEFPAGAGNGAAAIRVFGQPGFNTGTPPTSVSAQTLASPQGITVDASLLYVADYSANRVLVFPSTTTSAPTGSSAAVVLGQAQFGSAATGGGATGLQLPVDVGLDSSGNIYVSDAGNNRVAVFPSVLFLPLAGASAMSVVGQHDITGTSPNWNSNSGLATPEGLFGPFGLFVDRRDTLYVGDAGNNRIVHFLKTAAMVNAATPQAGIPVAPGAMVTISGVALSDSSENSAGTPLPAALANREVVINDAVRSALSSVTPSQISMQAPWATPVGTPRFAVRVSDTAELVAGSTVTVAPSSPGLFSVSGDGKGQGNILNQDGSANSASNAAARGSVIKIFGTGQGPVSPPVADGDVPASDSSVNTIAVPTSDGQTCLSQQSVCVAIGSTFGDIQFSGLAPGMVGTWQITVKIPAGAPTGSAVNLRAVINGSLSNLVTVAIK